MFQKQTDPTLDELIDIVNFQQRQHHIFKSLMANAPEKILSNKMVPQQCDKTSIGQDLLGLKYLQFKPWSGNDSTWKTHTDGNQVIREEIQALENDQIKQSEHQEDQFEEPETPLLQIGTGEINPNGQIHATVETNVSQITNMAKHNEIGYFYKFQNNPIKLIKKLLDQNGFKYTTANKNWTMYWSSSAIKMETYHALLPYQKINHFPNSFHLTRKDLMNKCISKMQIKYGISHFNFLPKTYILPGETSLLLEEINKNTGYMYIVKPHNRSQGKGIIVTSSLPTILAKLQKYSSIIVSHYIANPLLINNLKFDLRIYVAITSVNPLRIYVYEEGLGRFATEKYDSNIDSEGEGKKYQHLTNYSINKKNSEFIKSQNESDDYYGSKWSLTALKDFLSFNIGKTETSELFDRIDDVIVKTIISGQNILFSSFLANVPYNNSCFEVLGFDIMIDSNLKPWLIEVNMSPSMNSDSPIDIKIKANMIADLFTMVGIAPLNERYIDGCHIKQEIKNFIKPDHKNVERGNLQKFVLREVKLQNQRRGAWNRVFPTSDRRYKQFFEVDRYFNKLIRDEETILQIEKKNNLIQNINYNSVNTAHNNNINHMYSSVKNNNPSNIPRQRIQQNIQISLRPTQLNERRRLSQSKEKDRNLPNNNFHIKTVSNPLKKLSKRVFF